MSRTRSETAHRKVLEAGLTLVAERGFEGASMDAIAELSGVSKATIYKHWSHKDALLLEMMAELNGLRSRPVFNSGDTRADLIAVLTYFPPGRADVRERIMPEFMAYSARSPSFGDAWRTMVMEPPRQELKGLIKLGIEKGELSAELDQERSLSVLLGPIAYWYVFLRKSGEDPKKLAQYVVDVFWRAFGLKKKGRGGAMAAPKVRTNGRAGDRRHPFPG